MNVKQLFSYVWKLPLCGFAFFLGLMVGGGVASGLGLIAPSLPEGVAAEQITISTLVGATLLALPLAWLSRGLTGGLAMRGLVLSLLIWLAHGLNNYLEARIFTSIEAASFYTVVMYLPAALLLGGTAALLFPPAEREAGWWREARPFFGRYDLGGWSWRLGAALIAFPLIYLLFGRLIAPLVIDFYREEMFGLVLPTWGEIVPTQLLRSGLFLLAVLPIVAGWRRSSRRLVLALGLALFMLVGGISMLSAVWYPPLIPLVHGLEMLADEIVYAAVVVWLLRPSNKGLAVPPVDQEGSTSLTPLSPAR